MHDKQLEKLLKKIDMDSDVKAPKNLAAKISESVAVHAQVLERRKVILSFMKLALAGLLALYGLTAAIISLMKSSVSVYLASFFEDPNLFFSSNGVQAVLEKLPFFSVLLATLAGIYVLKHLAIKGVSKNPYVFATAMSVLGVVVMTGMFVAGMAIGVNSSEGVQMMAGTALFEPLLEDVSESDYSLVGQVVSVGGIKNGKRQIVLQLADKEERSILISDDMLQEQLGREARAGDQLLIFGKPEIDRDAPVEMKGNSEKPPINVNYLRVLTN